MAKMTRICGIDEAGKGPVIGPLVVCGVVLDSSKDEELKTLGVKDSKLLSPDRRAHLYNEILKLVDSYDISVLHPSEIDSALQNPSSNLLWFEADVISSIINKLKPDTAFIDCPCANISSFNQYLKAKLNTDTKLVSEHKADLNHPSVAAASILAKVTRDNEIVKIQEEVGDFGSGYPSDPKTKSFLEKNYRKYPDIFRKTWQTYKNIITKKEQKGLFDF